MTHATTPSTGDIDPAELAAIAIALHASGVSGTPEAAGQDVLPLAGLAMALHSILHPDGRAASPVAANSLAASRWVGAGRTHQNHHWQRS